MIIECAGTRGSIPCGSLQFCKYGGDTISIRITAKSGDTVVIDAGSGIRSIGNVLADSKSTKPLHLFFTHYHLDHILGIPFFKPLYNKDQKITIYGPLLEGTDGVKSAFKNIMTAPLSPVSFDGTFIKAKITFETISEDVFNIGSLKITSIRINHPNHGGLGYKIEEDNKTFVFLTDNELKFSHQNGHTIDEFTEFCRDADLLFHDAQFTDKEYPPVKGWGHSTIEDVISLGTNANCKKVGLFHYAPERTDSDVNELYSAIPSSTNGTLFFPLIQGTKFTL